jgi:hypothetical protein
VAKGDVIPNGFSGRIVGIADKCFGSVITLQFSIKLVPEPLDKPKKIAAP